MLWIMKAIPTKLPMNNILTIIITLTKGLVFKIYKSIMQTIRIIIKIVNGILIITILIIKTEINSNSSINSKMDISQIYNSK